MEASATLTIPRMCSDAAGECRFDQTDISLVMKEDAPPAAPVAVSAPRAVQRSIHDAHGEDCIDATESDAMPTI